MRRIDNVDVEIIGGDMEDVEVLEYISHIRNKYNNETLLSLKLTIDEDFIDMNYHLQPHPVERIRRITGYLVGTLDRFNDAKLAEEHDRVKHSL
ncbi:MAG: anaerobic ribonucleoside-triphosphate reductase [Coprobacillus sp.]